MNEHLVRPAVRWALVALLCTGCDGGPDANGRATVPAAVVEDGGFRTVVTTAPRQPPRRFTAGFPPSRLERDEEPFAWPSDSDVRRGTCSSQDFRDDLAFAVGFSRQVEWLSVLAECSPEMVDETFCRWVVDHFAGDSAAAMVVARACSHDESARAAVMASESPDHWVFVWAQRGGSVDVARAAQVLEPMLVREAVYGYHHAVLSRLEEDPSDEAGALLLSLYRRAPSKEMAARIGQFLGGRDDPEMQAIHARSCNGETHCEVDRTFDAWSTLAEYDFHANRVLRDYPLYRQAVLQELERCAMTYDGEDRAPSDATQCLAELIWIDPGRARASMPRMAPVDPLRSDAWRALAAAFRAPEKARVELADAGFGPFLDDEPGTLPYDTLVATGQALPWPQYIEHVDAGWALAELTAFARLAVPTAVQDHVSSEPTDTWQPRRVHLAWMDGLRFRALGAPAHRLPSLDRLVGFVNALLHHREAPERLASGWLSSRRVVVRASPEALTALVEAGHFVPDPPPEAEGVALAP